MGNFARGFSREFRPGTAANIFLNNLFIKQRQQERRDFWLNQQELDKLAKEREINRNRDIISQLESGTQTVGGDVTRGYLPAEFKAPLNEQQQRNLFAQLTPAGRTSFNAMETFNKRFEPEKIPPIENIEIVDAGSVKGQESYKGYLQRVETKRDPKTNEIISSKLKGQPYKVTETKTKTISGKDVNYTGISKETSKDLKDYFNRQQDLTAKLNAVRNGVEVWDKNFFNVPFLLTEKDLTKQLNQVNAEYQGYLKNNQPLSVNTWLTNYEKNYGEASMDDPDSMLDLYGNIYSDYTDGKIDEATYVMLLNNYRAKYGFDPESKFGDILRGR